ncbi:MAG: class I SAM-dependent methyltransferase, partial [Gemmatimonadota bacterium]
ASHLQPGGWLAVSDLDTEDGTFHDHPHPGVHPGFDRAVLVSLLQELGLVQARAVTAHVVRKERPDGVKEYPLFLLTGQRPS